MKLKRIEPGRYESEDGRVQITREVSRQTYRADEVVWEVTVDGKTLPGCEDTRREAVLLAEKVLAGGRSREQSSTTRNNKGDRPMSKHTPGPWDCYPYDHGAGHHGINSQSELWKAVADVSANKLGRGEVTEEEAEANARLIAAAPEMYDVLSRLADECLREVWPLDVTVREALSVLAKAEGGVPPDKETRR